MNTQNSYYQPVLSAPLFEEKGWADSLDYNRGLILNNELDESNGLLSYLPLKVEAELQITPKSKQLIERATRQHIYGNAGGDPRVNATEVLQVIESEFKCSDVPVAFGKEELHFNNKTICQRVSRILSFAAYHRLPTEISAQLLDGDDALSEYQDKFIQLSNWSNVVFPRGLAIRPPRFLSNSLIHRFNPIPRQLRTKGNILMAKQATTAAARAKAPPTLLEKQEFLDSLDREMTAKKKFRMLDDVLPFFPTKGNIRKFVMNQLSKMNSLLEMGSNFLRISATAIRAILLSYFMIVFPLFSASLIWRWQKLSATFCVGSSAITSSLMRISGILTEVYSAGCKNSLFVSTLAIAPFSNMIIKKFALRLQLEDDTEAMLKISKLLALSHIFVGAIVFLLDAAMVRSIFRSELLQIVKN